MRKGVSSLAFAGALSLGAPYAAAQGAPVDMDKRMQQMRENVRLMQQQMDKIHEAKDPKARHELLDEHAKAMRENMELLRGMAGPALNETLAGHEGAMGGEMAAGAQPGGGPKALGGDPMAGMDAKQREEFLQQRMDMMQMMMEQIMRHELMMQAAPPEE